MRLERQSANGIEPDERLTAQARRVGSDLESVENEALQQRWIEENRGVLATPARS